LTRLAPAANGSTPTSPRSTRATAPPPRSFSRSSSTSPPSPIPPRSSASSPRGVSGTPGTSPPAEASASPRWSRVRGRTAGAPSIASRRSWR
jgi:hypothetical protein